MNLKHLFYFWKVAKAGGVLRAGEELHITPQTISGQLRLLEDSLGTALFRRQGRALELTEAGRVALKYAEEMFSLSAELEQAVRYFPKGRGIEFRVGVSDVLPKSLAYRLLEPAVTLEDPVRIICREGRLDRLLADLALHRLDLVLADSPIPSAVDVRAYNHRLGESGVSFLAASSLLEGKSTLFPECLGSLPLLIPGEDSAVRPKLMRWIESLGIRPRVAGEFDDSALMTAFGRAGVGVFTVPTATEQEAVMQGGLTVLGRTRDIQPEYSAISVERRLTHPCVLAITQAARLRLETVGTEVASNHAG